MWVKGIVATVVPFVDVWAINERITAALNKFEGVGLGGRMVPAGTSVKSLIDDKGVNRGMHFQFKEGPNKRLITMFWGMEGDNPELGKNQLSFSLLNEGAAPEIMFQILTEFKDDGNVYIDTGNENFLPLQ
jgi:hypothetical protein